jgi:putative addiction module component (TIGR02574 family)
MSTSLEAIQAEVLRLSPSDRSRLLERLIVSLDADAEVEAEWEAFADAREAEITSGVATAVPLEEAVARLEARFKCVFQPIADGDFSGIVDGISN